MAGTGDELVIEIGIGEQADAESLAEATYHLRRELGELDLKRVSTPPAAPAPVGARGPDFAAIGTLIVTLGQGHQLGEVLAALLEWVSRHGRRSVRVELDGDVLEVNGVSAHDQRRIINDWLQRHRGS
jgi:hypothetical protein